MRVRELAVPLDPDSPLPLFLQIARAIADDIRNGRLRPADSLPGSRALARELGVHRNTVLAGFRELQAEGWIETRVARGTFVAKDLPTSPLPSGNRVAPSVAPRPAYAFAAPLWYDEPPPYGPGMLVLTKGAPDVRLLPAAELARAYRRVLLRHGPELLTYGDPRGHVRLRAALAGMLTTARGIPADPDDILVTRGSQLGLSLAARALIEAGDVVAVEALGHPQVWNAFRLAGAELVPVPVDRDGLCVDALAPVVARRPIRAVLVTPHHQFPTTTVMPTQRRLELLEFARERGIAIIEDDYDHEFHYDGRSILPLASGDRTGSVIYVGTLSKILAPGLRLGFVVAPRTVIARMTSLRVATDLQGDLAVECALAELFASGEFGRHVRRMRRLYRSRRDALVEALRRHLPDAVDFRVPSGGMALWVRAAPDIDVETWARHGASVGVAFRGGRIYDFAGAYQPYMRLGFTFHEERELDEAAQRMARALVALRREPRVRRGASRSRAPRGVTRRSA